DALANHRRILSGGQPGQLLRDRLPLRPRLVSRPARRLRLALLCRQPLLEVPNLGLEFLEPLGQAVDRARRPFQRRRCLPLASVGIGEGLLQLLALPGTTLPDPPVACSLPCLLAGLPFF